MEISGDERVEGDIRPGPGEVLQIAAGFMKTSGNFAESLYKKAANVATFSIEQY
jgi:hypothetical protein